MSKHLGSNALMIREGAPAIGVLTMAAASGGRALHQGAQPATGVVTAEVVTVEAVTAEEETIGDQTTPDATPVLLDTVDPLETIGDADD